MQACLLQFWVYWVYQNFITKLRPYHDCFIKFFIQQMMKFEIKIKKINIAIPFHCAWKFWSETFIGEVFVVYKRYNQWIFLYCILRIFWVFWILWKSNKPVSKAWDFKNKWCPYLFWFRLLLCSVYVQYHCLKVLQPWCENVSLRGTWCFGSSAG